VTSGSSWRKTDTTARYERLKIIQYFTNYRYFGEYSDDPSRIAEGLTQGPISQMNVRNLRT
jgi:hypothetical protein